MSKAKCVLCSTTLLFLSRAETQRGLDLRWNYLVTSHDLPHAGFIVTLDQRTDSTGIRSYFEAVRRNEWRIWKANVEFRRAAIIGRQIDIMLGDTQYRDRRSTLNLRGLGMKYGSTRVALGRVGRRTGRQWSFNENRYLGGITTDFSILRDADLQVSLAARSDKTQEDGVVYNRVLTTAWRCSPADALCFPLAASVSVNNLKGKEIAGLSYSIGGAIGKDGCRLSIDYRGASSSYMPLANLRQRDRRAFTVATGCMFARYLLLNGRFDRTSSICTGDSLNTMRYQIGTHLTIPEFPVFSVFYDAGRQRRVVGTDLTKTSSSATHLQLLKEINGYRFRVNVRRKRWRGNFSDLYSLYSLSIRKRIGIVELGLNEAMERGYVNSSFTFRVAAGPSINLTHELSLSHQGVSFSIGGNVLLPNALMLSLIHRNETGDREGVSLWLSIAKNFDIGRSGDIEGIVFVDTNRNGKMDHGETGLSNIVITLDGVSTCRTDSRGEFSFRKAERGIHTISLDISTLSARYNPVLPIERSVWVKWLGCSRVEFPVQPIIRIGGRVLIERDNNGLLDNFEKGLAGVVIFNLTSSERRVTDERGYYYFEDALPQLNRIELDTTSLKRQYRVIGQTVREVKLSSYDDLSDINFVVVRKVDRPYSGVFKVQGIKFFKNSSNLVPSSYPLLDKAAELLKTHPEGRVTVHLLNQPSDFALQRFRTLVEYFLSKGTPTDRFRMEASGRFTESKQDVVDIDIKVGSEP